LNNNSILCIYFNYKIRRKHRQQKKDTGYLIELQQLEYCTRSCHQEAEFQCAEKIKKTKRIFYDGRKKEI